MFAYKNAIMRYSPDHWNKLDGEQTDLLFGSDEFNQIAYEVRYALSWPNKTIAKIKRIQNVHDLGQLLIREQLLIVADSDRPYYRVRRFIKVKKQFLENALKYNLDHRRCGLTELVFHSTLSNMYFLPDDVLLVVQVVTSSPNDSVVRPSNNLEYFIDYVVEF